MKLVRKHFADGRTTIGVESPEVTISTGEEPIKVEVLEEFHEPDPVNAEKLALAKFNHQLAKEKQKRNNKEKDK
jgi:ribosome-associated translation inhibitor RaiA